MTRKDIIAIVTKTLVVALSAFSACLNFGAEPSESFDELIAQTLTEPVDSKAVEALVNKLARAQDVVSAEKAVDQALALDEYPLASVERLVACYYHLRLRAAVTDGSAEEFDAYAQRLLDDTRRSDVCANVAIQACRNLGFYDSERAKKLYLDLIADFSGSEFAPRRAAADAVLRSGLAPDAASDAILDLAPYRAAIDSHGIDEASIEPGVAARSFGCLTALVYANNRAYGYQRPNRTRGFIPPASRQIECMELSATYADAIIGSDFELRLMPTLLNISIDMNALTTSVSTETNPDVILNVINVMNENASRDIKANYGWQCYDAYFKALGLKASRDGSDEAFDRYVDHCVEILKTAPREALDVAPQLARELKYANERLVDRFLTGLRASDVSELKETADLIEGTFRFDDEAFVGQRAILEGVCQDGDQITLDDYAGKTVLLYMCPYPLQINTSWLETYYDKYHDSGLEIVLYGSAIDNNYMLQTPPNVNQTSRNIKTILRKRTAANPELGGREYADMTSYYGLCRNTPVKFVLIDSKGKVAAKSNKAGANYVENELQKLFPKEE